MITLFHGENIALSRKAFTSLREKEREVISFDGSNPNLTDFVQATQSQDLFATTQKIICIEEFFSKRKASKEVDALVHAIAKAGNENTIIIWESKELTPKQIKNFAKATVQKFEFPKTLFAFLDSLKPGNSKQAIQLFHECLQTEEPELLFFMMIRQVRILLALIEPSGNVISNPIDEIKRIQPWQSSKLQKQATLFGKDQLIFTHHKLFDLERRQKTGQLSQKLSQEIDFLLLSL